jgi:peptidyl-prolyl cis-trans isomerase B (cyclophilin B)
MKTDKEEIDFIHMPQAELTGYRVVLETNAGAMEFEMWPDVAPEHVRNFLDLAHTGFYDGKTFHRVIRGFMIQGGCPVGTGTGGGPRRLRAEFNSRPHERGVLSMARSSDPNSASCQFFVMHARSPHLDGQHSGFGKLVRGDEVLEKLATTPTMPGDRPRTPQTIQKARVIHVAPKLS